MSALPHDQDTVSADQAQRLDAICDPFEDAWKSAGPTGSAPQLEDFLKNAPDADQSLVLRELIHTDVFYRRKRGETPRPSDYLGRFPALDTAWLTAHLAAAPLSEGRYLILGEIARGGMGAILRGRDPDFNRELAIKIILPERVQHQDEAVRREMLDRFLAEAKIAGQLQHPGIVPVYELGEFPGDRRYFTMKLVKGRTLAALLDERPGPGHELPRFLKIFEQVCQTMAYAHSRRVIHRDLKPLNIMVGAFGEVQVMDWGLAKVMGGPAEPASPPAQAAAGATDIRIDPSAGPGLASQHGWGTLEYMPPEQARGEVDRLNTPCDVFALGAILCKILTGQPPYVGRGAEALRLQAIKADLKDAFVRLDACGAEPELIRLARHCLAARPEDRPADAGAAATAVTAYLAGVQERLKEAEMARAAALVRAAEERKRRKVTVALAATMLILVLGGGGVAFRFYRQGVEREARRQQLTQKVTAALAEAQQTRTELQQQLGDPMRVHELLGDIDGWGRRVDAVRRAWQNAQRLAESDKEFLGEDLAEQVRGLEGQVEADERDRQLARELDNIILEVITPTPGHPVPSLEAPLQRYAALFRRFDLEPAEGEPAVVAEKLRRLPLRYALATALDFWALNSTDQKRLTRLLETARQADPDPWRDQLRDPTVWQDPSALIRLAQTADVARQSPLVLAALGMQLHLLGGEAGPLLQRALATYPQDFCLNLMLNLTQIDQPAKADEGLRAILALRPRNAVFHTSLGHALSMRNEFDGAAAHFQKAVELDPKNATAHQTLAQALLAKGDMEGAAACCEKALALDPQCVPAFVTLCMVRNYQGEYELARSAALAALERLPPEEAYYRPQAKQLLEANNTLLAQDEQVTTILKRNGGAVPAERANQLLFGDMCRNMKHYPEAVRFYAAALSSAEPVIYTAPGQGLRYQAAITAVLAGTGQGRDARLLPEPERAKLRRQALEWLKADLGLLGMELPLIPIAGVPPEVTINDGVMAKLSRWQELSRWQQDVNLASVREENKLARLPTAEQRDWRQLWSDVDAFMKKIRAGFTNTVVLGFLTKEAPQQVLSVKMTAGKSYVLDLHGRSIACAMRLEDTQGKTLTTGKDDGNHVTRIVFTAPGDDTYRVVVAASPVTDPRMYHLLIRETGSGFPPAKPGPSEVQATPGETPVQVAWVGTQLDDSLEKLKPKSGVIVDQHKFAKLWKAWRKDEMIPVVDFTKQFVAVVSTKVRRPANFPPILRNVIGTDLSLHPYEGTEKLAKGFEYEIHVIERAGIKTFNGKPLPTK